MKLPTAVIGLASAGSSPRPESFRHLEVAEGDRRGATVYMLAEATSDQLTATDRSATADQSGATAFSLILWILVLLYLLPMLIALVRRVPNRGSIIIVNVFAGFTLCGWVTALALACRSVDRSPAPAVVPVPMAGWYPDPASPARLRYFDGVRWTARVATPLLEYPPSVSSRRRPGSCACQRS